MITAIYIDSKALDVVSHRKFFHKLSAYGIGRNLLAWITHLLTSRIHNTRVGKIPHRYIGFSVFDLMHTHTHTCTRGLY